MFTVADARRYAHAAFIKSAPFSGSNAASPLLDADALLQHFLQKPRAWLFAHADTDITETCELFYAAVEQRCAGLPIAYITGIKEFWGLPFQVNTSVLIPKPDTELLVERSIALITEKAAAGAPCVTVLDPCTGSGCVGIAALHTLFRHSITNVFFVLSDISEPALDVARLNAKALLPPEARERVLFAAGDMRRLGLLTAQLPDNCRRFDLIAANPPYVPSALTQELLKDGRSEPLLALDGGTDGLDYITVLTNNAPNVLKNAGILLSEAGEYHAERARAGFEKAGFREVRIHRDLSQKDRLIEGRWYDSKN